MLYARAITQAPFGRPEFISVLFLLALLLAPFPAVAADAVGKVILSIGQNQAVGPDGQVRKLARKAEVYADDLLATGNKGRLQVRFTDGSRLSLRSGTEFKITEYRFDAAEPKEGKAIYKLLKGGMRTLSGQIGKEDKEDYRLDTAVATIGIRGTDFVIISEGDSVTGSVNSGEINVAGNEGSRSENITAGNSFVIQTQGAIQVLKRRLLLKPVKVRLKMAHLRSPKNLKNLKKARALKKLRILKKAVTVKKPVTPKALLNQNQKVHLVKKVLAVMTAPQLTAVVPVKPPRKALIQLQIPALPAPVIHPPVTAL
ncbi:FecR family protein [Aliamphritea spongicola]|nr:FecR family protein [Aliamphritea spongicola]